MLISPKLRCFLLIWVILASFTTISMAYSGGSGTQADPYQIATAQDLIDLGNTTADYSKYFIMTADIDLAGRVFDKAVIAPANMVRDYFDGMLFTGNFNGDKHVISNLVINGSRYCGLFGYNAGVVTNLGLENIKITGTDDYIGGLCGINGANISNCFIVGSVSGHYYIGGLCGYSSSIGFINNCYTECLVTGGTYIGGLSGSISGSITDSYATGSVVLSGNAFGTHRGGLFGYNQSATISNCFWDKQLSGMEFGVNSGSTAGMIGLNTTDMQNQDTFTSYNWDFTEQDGDATVWQIVSNWYPIFTWDNPMFMQFPDLSGKTLEQSQTVLTNNGMTLGTVSYLYNRGPEGLIGYQYPHSNILWRIGFPVRVNIVISKGQRYSGGNGTQDDPYLLATAADLIMLSNSKTDYRMFFKMTSDIDLSDRTFYGAIIASSSKPSTFEGTPFNGNFDGNGYAIKNATIKGNNYYSGVFGYLDSAGTVKNLKLDNVNVTGSFYVGGLCGYSNSGTIKDCSITCTISGKRNVGGMCGYDSGGKIQNCFVNGSITGESLCIGGLLGYSSETSISGCHTYGSVTSADGRAGGICGQASSIIENCSSSCFVSGLSQIGGICGYLGGRTVKNSFASGQIRGTVSVGGLIGEQTGIIENCYSICSVFGTGGVSVGSFSTGGVGGLCGRLSSGIINCSYATGSVFSNYGPGGICGKYVSGTISNSFFYEYSCPDNGFGTSVTDENLLDQRYFIGFDFDGNTSDGTQDIWNIEPGYMPHLNWQDISGYSSPRRLESISTTLQGNGKIDDPFIIASANDLYELSSNQELRFGYYSIISDIDLSGFDFYCAVVPELFWGYFEGNDHVIRNLNIHGASECGMFSKIFSASINNIRLENVKITANSSNIGGICGSNISSSKIYNCHVTGEITGNADIGGICGNAFSGILQNCSASVNVNGNYYTGGLCGFAFSGISIVNCYSTGLVVGADSTGGLCGYASGDITNCYSDVSVSGTQYVGGLCGQSSSNVINSYSAGTVSGSIYVGGFSGMTSGNISCCYSVAKVIGASNYIGGFSGKNSGNISNCYFYRYAGPDNGYGDLLDFNQLHEKNAYIGFDFVGDNNDGVADVWEIEDGYLPRLAWQASPGLAGPQVIETTLSGNGTVESPFLISNIDDLNEFSAKSDLRAGYYLLTSDIDLTGTTFPRSIVLEKFWGVFDGNGHTISGLSINDNVSANTGLFTNIYNATIKNLTLKNVNIIGNNGFTGSICGYATSSTISNCHVTGSVIAKDAGGLVGYNSGEISNCSSVSSIVCTSVYAGGLCGANEGKIQLSTANGNVVGNNMSSASGIGGLCGYNYNVITNCYSLCSISGKGDYVGGLSGVNSSIIVNSYSIGSVLCTAVYSGGFVGYSYSGSVTGCFWDKQASTMTAGVGYGTNTGIYGLNTVDMQKETTFTTAGWDFSEEDGDAADWKMPENWYPVMPWEIIELTQVPDLTGLTLEQAVTLLESKGLVTGNISYSYNAGPANLVYEQTPAVGKILRAGFGERIDIKISIPRYSGGKGTQVAPYVLANTQDIINLGKNTSDYNKYFLLTSDIDMTGYTFTQAVVAPDPDTDVTFDGTAFTGNFNGNGHTISNLTINGSNYCGLFGYVGSAADISNLIIENASINCTGRYNGCMIAYSYGKLSNCYVYNSILSINSSTLAIGDFDYAGLLIGCNMNTISKCGTYGSIASNQKWNDFIGGFCGGNNGTISESFANVDINVNGSNCYAIGGFVGAGGYDSSNLTKAISKCYATGEMNVNSSVDLSHIGGFSGFNPYCSISSCYATVDIVASVGTESGYHDPRGSVGGFLGTNWSVISNCYASGVLHTDRVAYTGGFCGYLENVNSKILNCFWNTQASQVSVGCNNSTSSTGIITNLAGKTTVELKNITTFTAAGWYLGTDWKMLMGNFPYLSWQTTPDINNNGLVDMTDFALLADNWLETTSSSTAPDFNINGSTDLDDLVIFADNWLNKAYPSLIGHWSLDETSGTIAADVSEYNNPGTVYGGPAYGTGVDGGCYVFDGVNDYVSVPIVISPSAGPFTACLWAKGGVADQNFICQTNGTGTGRIWLGLTVDNKIRTGLGGTSLIANTTWDNTAWHHVAIVWDGTRRHIYIDGVIAIEDTANISTVEYADGPIYLGTHKGLGTTTFWNGSLDDVRIYNKALTAQEITDLQ